MKTTRTINWTAGTGNEIEITMTAQYGFDLAGNRKTSGRLEITVDTTVDGNSLGGMAQLELISHPLVAAKIGNGTTAVGMTHANLARYNAVYGELVTLIAANNSACDNHETALDAVSDEARSIENAMACGE
jgi:hypothetical protein